MISENSDKKFELKKAVFVNALVILAMSLLLVSLYPITVQSAFAAKFILRVQEQVYSPGESLVIYGAGEPNDIILIRMFGPSGRAITIGNVIIDSSGFFREAIYTWENPSASIPFGAYTIEALSSHVSKDTRQVEVVFAESIPENDAGIPITHSLAVKLDSPDQVSIDEPFRVFIQVTFDGALVAANGTGEITDLLGASHIHLGEQSIALSDLTRVHEGLYYSDVTIKEEGAYIIHSEAFYRGLLAHDSKVVTATSSSISTIQQSVSELDSRLDSTNRELAGLQEGIRDTKGALNQTQAAITNSVNDAKLTINDQITDVQQASGQINSLILPLLALISVIIALQISLFARIRASYR